MRTQIKPFTYVELIGLIADLEAQNNPSDKDIITFYKRLKEKTEKEILTKILIELELLK